MDKWINKRKPNDDSNDVSDQANLLEPSTSKDVSSAKKCNVKIRKYHDEFLKYGFAPTTDNDQTVPECVICGCKL